MSPRRVALAAAACLLAWCGPARADEDGDLVRLSLRSQTRVTGTARLGDVLAFQQAPPKVIEQLTDQPLDTDRNAAANTEFTITHDQVRRRLTELGVNLGRVLLGGATACRVSVGPPPGALQHAAAETRESDAPLLRGPTGAPTGPLTLADAIRMFVDNEVAKLGGRGQVQFEFGGQDLLQLTTPPWDFDVRSPGTEKLGLREFEVVIREHGRVQRKVKLYARVQIVRPVVVAKRPLNPGNLVGSADITVEPRVFERAADAGLGELGAAVGRQVRRFVPAGEIVAPDALKDGDLVSRSRPVTVVSGNGGVQLRLTGVALDAGGLGDAVRVRMGDASRGRTIVQGVVTGLATVHVTEGR